MSTKDQSIRDDDMFWEYLGSLAYFTIAASLTLAGLHPYPAISGTGSLMLTGLCIHLRSIALDDGDGANRIFTIYISICIIAFFAIAICLYITHIKMYYPG